MMHEPQLPLTGDGKGNFQAISTLSSGLDAKGEVRRIIYQQDKKQIILLKNNAPAYYFRKLIKLSLSFFNIIIYYADGKSLSHSGKYCFEKNFACDLPSLISCSSSK